MAKYFSLLTAATVSVAIFQLVRAHSWLACTDYAEKDAAFYDHDLCRGYARSSLQFAPRGATFGQDRGYDYHASETKPCRNGRNDATEYDQRHPMAVYYPGQQVVLAHPMKNHGSDSCTNAHIPDHGNHIYRGRRDGKSDPTLSEFRKNVIANLGVKDPNMPLGQYPRPGYQNAPAFCKNTDKSLGTYSFNIPKDLEPGQYTFLWTWAFNGPQDLYSTCFEVKIVGTLAERNAQLQANGFFNTYEPCGGKTANFDTPGNSNPGCTGTGTGGTKTTTPKPLTTKRPVPAPTTTKKTTTTKATGRETNVDTNAMQIAGVIDLPAAPAGTIRRHVTVTWDDCAGRMQFWPARVTSSISTAEKMQYDLVQESYDIKERKIYYQASFAKPCNILIYPPMSQLTLDEK